ncbi:hypothetical protein [Pseudonocardia spinosispora]|uniref:hypothetical protein n=1 Tax=Pseudonocardia spinosispora TaxID=103441 RepID=UPI0012EC9145|nr:hypothetical protein [Pseudonocardia spinosispora]
MSVTPIYDGLRARSAALGHTVPRARRQLSDEDDSGGQAVVRMLSSRPGLGGRHRKPIDRD